MIPGRVQPRLDQSSWIEHPLHCVWLFQRQPLADTIIDTSTCLISYRILRTYGQKYFVQTEQVLEHCAVYWFLWLSQGVFSGFTACTHRFESSILRRQKQQKACFTCAQKRWNFLVFTSIECDVFGNFTCFVLHWRFPCMKLLKDLIRPI